VASGHKSLIVMIFIKVAIDKALWLMDIGESEWFIIWSYEK
jgi:hypothetical protein